MKIIELLNEIINRLQLALKCKDSELQCVFEAYEIEDMINKLITMKQLNDLENKDDEDEEKGLPEKLEGMDSLFEIEQDLDLKGFLAWQKANNKMIENKINEIIDYLENQRKGE